LIILIIKTNIDRGIEILSTNERLRPICVIVHYFKFSRKGSTIWPIASLVFIESIIFYTIRLNTVEVDSTTRNFS
jgi:hypothetical protein